MKPHVVQVRSRLKPDAIRALAGKKLPPELMAIVADQGDVDVFKHDGSPLLIVRRGAVPPELAEVQYITLEEAARKHGSDNRASYAGEKATNIRSDGTWSNSNRARREDGKILVVQSAVVGFFDRQGGRHPHCRTTAFTADDAARWARFEPVVQHVASVYRELDPKRYAVQLEASAKGDQHWIIPGTPFSTITANRNVLGAVHQDKGDFKGGMGVITCCRRGTYRGAVLGFPEYGVGVDLRDGDLILFSPHDWHGVTAMTDKSDDAVRLSAVYYLRSRMHECGTPEQELERARTMKDKQSGFEPEVQA